MPEGLGTMTLDSLLPDDLPIQATLRKGDDSSIMPQIIAQGCGGVYRRCGSGIARYDVSANWQTFA